MAPSLVFFGAPNQGAVPVLEKGHCSMVCTADSEGDSLEELCFLPRGLV